VRPGLAAGHRHDGGVCRLIRRFVGVCGADDSGQLCDLPDSPEAAPRFSDPRVATNLERHEHELGATLPLHAPGASRTNRVGGRAPGPLCAVPAFIHEPRQPAVAHQKEVSWLDFLERTRDESP
jgi:hypothetical protein